MRHFLCIVILTCWFNLCALATFEHAQLRKLLIRDIPAGTKCRNTVQGPQSIADSLGFFCTRDKLDYKTGCCAAGEQYTCNGCSMDDKCCHEYEVCVSCCLDPKHKAVELAPVTYRSRKQRSNGVWADAFEYCSGVCRSHGLSTAHENSYISSRHHCFSKLGRPLLSDPLPQGALNNIHVAISAQGESCDAACSREGKQCKAPALSLLNSCDRLREHLGCEAGCEVCTQQRCSLDAKVMPTYIDVAAPKPQRPAMCFTAPQNAALACSGKDPHARRLCPCS